MELTLRQTDKKLASVVIEIVEKKTNLVCLGSQFCHFKLILLFYSLEVYFSG